MKLIDILNESINEHKYDYEPGTELVFNKATRAEIKKMRSTGKEHYGSSLPYLTRNSESEIYIFQNYYGSNARVYPKGGNKNTDSFSVNADRFEKK